MRGKIFESSNVHLGWHIYMHYLFGQGFQNDFIIYIIVFGEHMIKSGKDCWNYSFVAIYNRHWISWNTFQQQYNRAIMHWKLEILFSAWRQSNASFCSTKPWRLRYRFICWWYQFFPVWRFFRKKFSRQQFIKWLGRISTRFWSRIWRIIWPEIGWSL